MEQWTQGQDELEDWGDKISDHGMSITCDRRDGLVDVIALLIYTLHEGLEKG
jgi:hypothetical protein